MKKHKSLDKAVASLKTKEQRRKLYKAVLKKGKFTSLCFSFINELFGEEDKQAIFVSWRMPQENLYEFSCFIGDDFIWCFGDKHDIEAIENRVFCLAMCIEMTK